MSEERGIRRTAGNAIIEFVAALREAGVRAELQRTEMLFEALRVAEARDLHTLHVFGRIALCGSQSDTIRYDQCFATFFFGATAAGNGLETDRQQPATLPAQRGAASKDPGQSSRDREVGASSPEEFLRSRKLAGLTAGERAQALELITRLRGKVEMRRSRRHQRAHRGVLDVRRTVRAAFAHGAELDRLYRRLRGLRPRKRVLLIDISGSMAPFSDGLLRFGYAAFGSAPRHTEVFTLGTRLTRITRYLHSDDPETALVAAAGAIPDWSGGTRLGDLLKAFLDVWGQRGMARGACVVLISDGWERGAAEQLALQMKRLSSLAHRIIWVNPHQSTPGFEPLTRGMQAALPYIDHFVAGSTVHEFSALLDLMQNSRLMAVARR